MVDWIRVEDALPDNGEDVAVWLVTTAEGHELNDLAFARYCGGSAAAGWRGSRGAPLLANQQGWRVTHWSRVALTE